MTLCFVAFSFALAFWQRTGWTTADTKIDLHVDPGRFLQAVASVWTPTTDLGEVHAAQYSGYLWPMGPFFAALHSIGLGAWVVERIWLGLLFALSVWGLLKLLDAARRTPAGGRPPRGRGLLPAEPVHGRLHGPDQHHPARIRRAAVAAADHLPRRACEPWVARLARVVVGGGVCADLHLHRRRRQRGGAGMDAGRPARARAVRAGDRERPMAGRLGFPGPCRSAERARVAVVDRAAAGACPLRDRLSAVHRAASHDLGDQQPYRVAAADGLLDLLHRRRLRRQPPVLQRRRDAAVQPAGGGRIAAAARTRRGRVRAVPGGSATPRSCCCWSSLES